MKETKKSQNEIRALIMANGQILDEDNPREWDPVWIVKNQEGMAEIFFRPGEIEVFAMEYVIPDGGKALIENWEKILT